MLFLTGFKFHLTQLNTGYRANVPTQQASHTFFCVAMRCAGFLIPFHRLMSAVITGDVAAATANAFIKMDVRVDDVATVKILRGDDIGIGKTNHLLQ